MRLALVLAAAAIAISGPAAAAAAPLGAIDRGAAVKGTVSTDGRRILAFATPRSAEFTLYDAATHARATIVGPPDCQLLAMDRDDELLWGCRDGTGAIGSPTGERTALPRPGLGTSDPGATYVGAGRYWLRVRDTQHEAADDRYVNRATGQPAEADAADRGVRFDLDSPQLTQKLCDGMQRPLVPAMKPGLQVGDLAIAGQRAAATTYVAREKPPAAVVLQRCGRKQRVLQRCPPPVSCSQPVIDGRILAWTRTAGDGRVRLYVRSLHSGRTRSLALGTGASDPVLAGHRLLVQGVGRLLEIRL